MEDVHEDIGAQNDLDYTQVLELGVWSPQNRIGSTARPCGMEAVGGIGPDRLRTKQGIPSRIGIDKTLDHHTWCIGVEIWGLLALGSKKDTCAGGESIGACNHFDSDKR